MEGAEGGNRGKRVGNLRKQSDRVNKDYGGNDTLYNAICTAVEAMTFTSKLGV